MRVPKSVWRELMTDLIEIVFSVNLLLQQVVNGVHSAHPDLLFFMVQLRVLGRLH
jgi:hypothetical protein